MTTKEIGNSLKQNRKWARLTQVDVFKMTNIPQATLSQYENGARMPYLENVIKLADCYNIPLDTLIGRRLC